MDRDSAFESGLFSDAKLSVDQADQGISLVIADQKGRYVRTDTFRLHVIQVLDNTTNVLAQFSRC